MLTANPPFDLFRRPKPPLDGYFWEDIVFVPARPPRPTRLERARGAINEAGGQIIVVSVIATALAMFGSISAERKDRHFAPAFLDDPDTTASIAVVLRPTLQE